MVKEYNGSPKHHNQLELKRKRLTLILGVSGLCILFYVIGARQSTITPIQHSSELYSSNNVNCDVGSSPQLSGTSSTSSSSSTLLDFGAHHQIEINNASIIGVQNFPPCDMSYSEYTPCQDRDRGRRFDREMLKYRERHCPTKEELIFCLIPAPPNYKTPFKWPQSRDFAWYDNIPHKELSVEKAIQNWIRVEGNRFRFPGGGTGFPNGADAYIDAMNELIPLASGEIRTAIDTGCGVS